MEKWNPADKATPIQDATDLNSLAPGLYFLPTCEDRRSYMPSTDEWLDGDSYEFVRIRPVDAPELPIGLDYEVRPDGCQIVKQWICVDPRVTARVGA